MADLVQLDHTVINVQYQMDKAEGKFRELGFHLTDRGYHTLGSINHLMMFDTDYIELIGLPEETGDQKPGRPDIANAPLGINGLVFKSSNVDETYEHLQKIGMAGDPPKSFSRPVELADGTTADACFRTVHLPPNIFPGGRVYFCEHGTPDLVWRPEWQSHQNGSLSMPEFVIASENHEKEANDFARLLHSDVSGSGESLSVRLEGSKISLLTPEAYKDRYGDLASSLSNRTSIFGAMVIKAESNEENRVVIRQEDFNCTLEFCT